MSDTGGHGDSFVRVSLGKLLADRERSAEDRKAMIDGLGTLHRRMDELAPIPSLFVAHEKQDADRHDVNTNRLDRIEARLGAIESAESEGSGLRKGIGLGLLAASAAGGGGLIAGAIELVKRWSKL